MQIISVVRHFDMYQKLVEGNPFYGKNACFTAYDNLHENLTIPQRYNAFLNGYDYTKPDWFVFCHEDWELKEALPPVLEKLDKGALYGPIGVAFDDKMLDEDRIIGQVIQSDKQGNNAKRHGRQIESPQEVGCFDCQCLIVHSSLVQKYHLRFDEKLSFDLYAEDFCINARESFGIASKALPLACQHFSTGQITDRFWRLLAYVQKKYKKAQHSYCSPVYFTVIGKKMRLPFERTLAEKVKGFFFQKKVTKSGKVRVKILKIPMPEALFKGSKK